MGPNDNLHLVMGDLTLTKNSENCRLVAYRPVPADPLTIGWGHTGPDVFEGLVWSQFKADSQLLVDMSTAENIVKRAVHIALTKDEFIALCDLAFNIGAGNFIGSTLLRKLNAADIAGTVAEFGKWNRAHGVVLSGLTRRRDGEKALFLLGADFTASVASAPLPISDPSALATNAA
jgi:lysozyme